MPVMAPVDHRLRDIDKKIQKKKGHGPAQEPESTGLHRPKPVRNQYLPIIAAAIRAHR